MKRTSIISILLLFACVSSLMADTDRATISGIVTDPSGATASTAKVTVVFPSTGYSRTSMTANDGSYTIATLPAGVVSLTIEKPGFRTVKYDNVGLDAGQVLKLNVQLAISTTTETIDVRSVGAALDQT